MGENGAGKSTLINVIAGLVAPDAGELRIAGHPAAWSGPLEARRHGIVTVHQEAELFGTLSVAENMALEQGLPTNDWGLVAWRAIYQRARHAVDLLGEPIDVAQPAARLGVAQRHMTEIAAAVLEQARVLVLDEPTSALTGAKPPGCSPESSGSRPPAWASCTSRIARKKSFNWPTASRSCAMAATPGPVRAPRSTARA